VRQQPPPPVIGQRVVKHRERRIELFGAKAAASPKRQRDGIYGKRSRIRGPFRSVLKFGLEASAGQRICRRELTDEAGAAVRSLHPYKQ
jgi:hypothetical protein